MHKKEYIVNNNIVEVYSNKKDVDFYSQCLFKILTIIQLFVNIIDS